MSRQRGPELRHIVVVRHAKSSWDDPSLAGQPWRMGAQLHSPPGVEVSQSFLVKLMPVPVSSQTMSAGVLPSASFLVTVTLFDGSPPGPEPTMIPPAKADSAAGRFAVTTETTTRFDRPLQIGRRHRVRAWITATDGRSIETAAEVVRDDGKRCAQAHAMFTALDLDQASSAAGATLSDETARYISADDSPASAAIN